MVRSSVPRKILGVIPARFSSTRFPGKVLAQIAGKTMLQHAYERAALSTYLTSILIATDAAILPMVHEPEVVMGTLKKRIEDEREITDPNVVKVVTDRAGDAIYFSRCAIPFMRKRQDTQSIM